MSQENTRIQFKEVKFIPVGNVIAHNQYLINQTDP